MKWTPVIKIFDVIKAVLQSICVVNLDQQTGALHQAQFVC